ncbi:MAG TPA: MFS transporter [Sphingopyxis sp.]|nr:MFS transporter [Sphingopyxis sp.]
MSETAPDDPHQAATSPRIDPATSTDAELPTRPSRYAWYALAILFCVYVLNFIDRQVITILAPDLKRDLGLTDADIGFLYGTAFAVFYALFGIPLGRLADSWHRVRLLTVGLSLWSAMTALSGLARNGTDLAAARIGVGIGEATASPAAYSLISDMFPKHMRGTALSIYSAGLYFGGGISLMIGGIIVESWNSAHPGGGPFGLVGWQAAFLAVGIPGLILALIVSALREPVRGLIDGLPTAPSPTPFKGFREELEAIIPPFTLLAAMKRGKKAALVNLAAAALAVLFAFVMARLTGSLLQWICVSFGYYAVFSWAASLHSRDNATFQLIWGNRAFMATVIGYGTVAFMNYSSGAFGAVYAQEVLGQSASRVGFWIGGTAAVAGFLGVILGGRMSDILTKRHAAGRIFVVAFGMIAPLPFTIAAFTLTPSVNGDAFTLFVIYVAIGSLLGSTALGAAAATTQELVLPRMRGTATATFFIGTTLIGLALGPYMAGYVSASSGSLSTGVLSTLAILPIGIGALYLAYRTVPGAANDLLLRAQEDQENLTI